MKYGGHFLKGLSSGLSQGFDMGMDWKRQKEEKDKIDKATEKMKTDSLELARQWDTARADGTITSEEYQNIVSWSIPLGNEMMNRVSTLMNNYKTLTSEEVDKALAENDAFWKVSSDLDFANINEMREFSKNITNEKAQIQWGLKLKSAEAQLAKDEEAKADEPEFFQDITSFEAKYPDREPVFSTKGIMAGEKKEKIPAKPTDYINAYNYLGALAENLTNEEWLRQRKLYEEETGMNLGGLTRESMMEIDAGEIQKLDFNKVMEKILNPYLSGEVELDEDEKGRIRNQWMMIRPLLDLKDQKRGDTYFAQIGIDLSKEIVDIDEDANDKDEKGFKEGRIYKGYKGLSDWVNSWIDIPELGGKQ